MRAPPAVASREAGGGAHRAQGEPRHGGMVGRGVRLGVGRVRVRGADPAVLLVGPAALRGGRARCNAEV